MLISEHPAVSQPTGNRSSVEADGFTDVTEDESGEELDKATVTRHLIRTIDHNKPLVAQQLGTLLGRDLTHMSTKILKETLAALAEDASLPLGLKECYPAVWVFLVCCLRS